MTDRRRLLQFLTYAMVGAVGTLAQYAVLVVSVSMHWLTPIIASVIGAMVGGTINYILNARITFRATAHSSALNKFAITALLGVAVNGLMMTILVDVFLQHYFFAQIVSTIIVLVFTYVINVSWTFRHGCIAPNIRKT